MIKAFIAIRKELELIYLSLKEEDMKPGAHTDDIKMSDSVPKGTMLGRAPMWTREGTPLPTNTRRINRYLRSQERKLESLIKRGQYNAAVVI